MKINFDAFDLISPITGKAYHTIPAQSEVEIKIVTRRNGMQEAAFIRNNGAWLPPVFHMGYAGEVFHDTKYF